MDPELARWKPFKKTMCNGCWSACCTLPVEASIVDLARLGWITELEMQDPPKAIAQRLLKRRLIQRYEAKKQIFVLAQVAGRDCIFLDENRRCKVYDKRPEVCRQFPKIGPRPGFCPHRQKTTTQS